MAATYMLRKHLRSQDLANRPEAVAGRAARVAACKRASEERAERFPVITPDNFEDADRYQKERAEHWTRVLLNA